MSTPQPSSATRALDDIREGRWTAALRNADAALAEGAREPWLPRLRGVALTNLGRVDEAVAILEDVAEHDPAPVVLHELVAAKIAARDALGARRAVNRALAVDADAAHTRRAAALLAMHGEDWLDAESRLRAVVMTDQFDIEALNNLAICLMQQGRTGEAAQHMGHARARGQATRHWRILDRNHDLVMQHRRPDDVPAAPVRPKPADGPRPSLSAALIRAGYEARKSPRADRPAAYGRGFYRVMITVLSLLVIVMLVGTALEAPPLGALAAIILIVFGVLWWRTRPGSDLVVLPPSARLRVRPRGRRSEPRAAVRE